MPIKFISLNNTFIEKIKNMVLKQKNYKMPVKLL